MPNDVYFWGNDRGTPRAIKVPIPSLNEIVNDSGNGIMGGNIPDVDIPEVEADKQEKPSRPKSFAFDPQKAMAFLQNIRRPSPYSAELLRTMAKRCSPVRAIIQTRKNQVSNFCTPAHGRSEMGFKIALKDRERKATASDKKRMKEVEYFLMHTGFPEYAADGSKRDDLETFIRKLVEDRLVLDSTCIERTYDRQGRLAEMFAVDGGTIRRVVNKINYMPQVSDWDHVKVDHSGFAVVPPSADKIDYVQMIKGTVVAELSSKQLVYAIGNPSTDIQRFGYGESELEMLVTTVTSHLFAEQYNRSKFTQGAIPHGVISLIGNYDQEMIEAFKRQWSLQVAGVTNAFKLPVIALTDGEGFKFTPFDMSSRDMEYHLWMTYLISVACAIYQIDPEEIGFQGYRPQPAGSLFSHSGEYKMEQSKDRGLKPLMRFIQKIINLEIIDYIYDDLCLQWVNFDEDSESEKLDMWIKELQAGLKTVNEIKAERDEKEIDAEWANAPANPTLLQLYNQEQQQSMQAEDDFINAIGQQNEERQFPKQQAEGDFINAMGQQNEEQQFPKRQVPVQKDKKNLKKSKTNDIVLEFIV